jgi:hypothetical protein
MKYVEFHRWCDVEGLGKRAISRTQEMQKQLNSSGSEIVGTKTKETIRAKVKAENILQF